MYVTLQVQYLGCPGRGISGATADSSIQNGSSRLLGRQKKPYFERDKILDRYIALTRI